ncbi:unnamed protein product [Merluccius merluccius]
MERLGQRSLGQVLWVLTAVLQQGAPPDQVVEDHSPLCMMRSQIQHSLGLSVMGLGLSVMGLDLALLDLNNPL